MTYSFYCSTCGYTFMSDSKIDVARVAKVHKKTGCLLLQKDKRFREFARPALVKQQGTNGQ